MLRGSLQDSSCLDALQVPQQQQPPLEASLPSLAPSVIGRPASGMGRAAPRPDPARLKPRLVSKPKAKPKPRASAKSPPGAYLASDTRGTSGFLAGFHSGVCTLNAASSPVLRAAASSQAAHRQSKPKPSPRQSPSQRPAPSHRLGPIWRRTLVARAASLLASTQVCAHSMLPAALF